MLATVEFAIKFLLDSSHHCLTSLIKPVLQLLKNTCGLRDKK